MSRAFTALRALVYMTGFVFLWGWLAILARDAGRGWPVPPSWSPPVGIVCMVLGGAVALACGATFVIAGRGTPAPFDPPRDFVPVGPYRYVRNPMYVGAVVLLAGFALVERSLAVLCLDAAGLAAAHLFVVFAEEPGLEQRFGDSYRGYKASVHRWVPRLPR